MWLIICGVPERTDREFVMVDVGYGWTYPSPSTTSSFASCLLSLRGPSLRVSRVVDLGREEAFERTILMNCL